MFKHLQLVPSVLIDAVLYLPFMKGNRQLNPRNCPILVIYVLLESTPEALTAQGRSFSSFSTVSA